MQENIHPNYKEVVVKCSCGNTFTTKSAFGKNELHLEICSQCHPFYTGKQKSVDTSGRVDKFKKRYAGQKAKQEKIAEQLTSEKETVAVDIKSKKAKKA